MGMSAIDLLHRLRVVVSGAFSSFRKNNDLSAASSLAFSATLALIPALFLLTFLLGAVIGSSGGAFSRTQELLTELFPAYSQEILREVRSISSHMGAIGLLNGLVLLWSVTPLVADMRIALGVVFRKKPTRAFLVEKLFDLAIGIVFLIGLSAIAIAGLLVSVLQKKGGLPAAPSSFEGVMPVLFFVLVIFTLYLLFSRRVPRIHLLAGAAVAALLWFSMRPAFHLFIMYNPGYGFAFGSFKSLFVVIIWIYCSFVVFLFGAEIAASLGRDETVFIKKLMEGSRSVPSRIRDKYVLNAEAGSVVFSEGDQGKEMYSILKGRVAIRKG
jgi:membrane protein